MGKLIFALSTVLMMPIRLFFSRVSPFVLIHDSVIDRHAAIGNFVRIYDSCLGRYSYVGRRSIVTRTTIGSFCSIAPDCIVGAPYHPLAYVSTSPVFYSRNNILHTCFNETGFVEFSPTKIGSDVWIGQSSFVKGGLTIGHGAIIGAHSVVTHDVEPYAVVAGNPARLIKRRFDDQIIEGLLELAYWNWDEERLKLLAPLFSDPKKLIAAIDGSRY